MRSSRCIWIVVAVALFALTLFLLATTIAASRRYKYIFGITAIALLLLPILPGPRPDGQRCALCGCTRFRCASSRESSAKIMLDRLPGAYMREKREVLAQGRPKDWGPLLVIWVLAILVLLETRDLGGGLLYFGSSSRCSTSPRRGRVRRRRLGLFLVGAIGVWRITPTCASRDDLLHP